MKKILILLILVFTSFCFSQNQNTLIGTWQQQTGNDIFRIEIEREIGQYEDGTPKSVTLGHFQIIELDNNGNETIILNSDQTINPNTPNSFQLPHAIRGGFYNYESSYYLFQFTDINGTTTDLHIEVLNNNSLLPNQIKWTLKGIIIGDLNVPKNATLTRQ